MIRSLVSRVRFWPTQQCRRLATISNNGLLKLEQPLKEHELFQDTIVRSIRNERELNRERRLEFNVDALVKVATEAAGATHCVGFTKLAEGQCNRVFLLQFDNGKELVARLPFCSSVAPYFTTASEVATLTFLRRKAKIPVPTVYAWSSRSAPNDVGAEFMITDKTPGIELQKRLPDFWANPDHLISEIVKIRTLMSQTPFSQFGSLYFKEDVDEHLQSRRLYAEGVPDDEFSDMFRIGPSLHRSLWQGNRSKMQLDRGPWKDVPSYARAIALSEKAWLEQFAKRPSEDSHEWRSGDQCDPAAHIDALDRYLKIVPFITPPAAEASAACLLHPDYHAGNVFVQETGPLDIKGIIDWQGVGIGPLYQQMKMPDFLGRCPIGAEEDGSSDKLAEAYQELINGAPPPLSIAAKYNATTWTALLSCAVEVWPTNLALLRLVLIHVCDRWYSLFSHTRAACPIRFTPEERRIQAAHWEERMEAEALEDCVVQALNVNPDGWVPPKMYEDKKRRNRELLAEQCARARDDAERRKLRRLWPFREEL